MSLPKTKKLSWILLILGGLLGLPSVWVFPQILIWVIAPALAALWFWCRPSYSFKRSFFGELLVCALYGFVLVAGFSLGISGYLDTPLLLMGWVFSILFLLVTSVRNFEHLMAEHLISSINFVHRLGFDRARTYLLFLWSVSGASVLLWQSFFGASFWVFVFTLHYLTIGCILWFFSQKVVSPLGSRKRKLSRTYRGAILSVYFLLMIQMAILGFW
jgi:1,4-dihydroxy-2-naphthoate octaprenyltransferase